MNLYIYVYSHHFVCNTRDSKTKNACLSFSKNLVHYKVQSGNPVPCKVYACSNKDRTIFRFHINILKEFKEHLLLNEIYNTNYSVEYIPISDGQTIDMNIKPTWNVRENQLSAVEYLENHSQKNKLLPAQTGFGKGFITIKALSTIGKRVVIIVKPRFMEKWQNELLQICELTTDQIMLVQGNGNLLRLLQLAKDGLLTEPVIIISNRTVQNWYKAYEELEEHTLDLGYSCLPHELFDILGAGVRVVDEVHMDIHLQCKIDLYTHVADSISLSATLLDDDPFVERMQNMMYPIKDRFVPAGLNRYMDAFAITYKLHDKRHVKTTSYGSNSYSHLEYEKYIIKNKSILNNYIRLISHVIDFGFGKVDRPKKKLLVYASSIDMCSILTLHFKNLYKTLDVRRYCEDDDYSNLIDPDIRFSTILSAGTGHDIPDLTTVIMTTSISSTQSNIQASGRLRQLSDGHPVEFYYLVCEDIPKQMFYHKNKIDLFSKRAKSFKQFNSGYTI